MASSTVVYCTYANPPTESQRNIVKNLSTRFSNVIVVPLRNFLNLPSDIQSSTPQPDVTQAAPTEETDTVTTKETLPSTDEAATGDSGEESTGCIEIVEAPIQQEVPFNYSRGLLDFVHRLNMSRLCFESIGCMVNVVEIDESTPQGDWLQILSAVTDKACTLCMGADEYVRFTNVELKNVQEDINTGKITGLRFDRVICISRYGYPMPMDLAAHISSKKEVHFAVFPHVPTSLEFLDDVDGAPSTQVAMTFEGVKLMNMLHTHVLCYMERFRLYELGRYSCPAYSDVNVLKLQRNTTLDVIQGLRERQQQLMPQDVLKPCIPILADSMQLLLQSQVYDQQESVVWIAKYLKENNPKSTA